MPAGARPTLPYYSHCRMRNILAPKWLLIVSTAPALGLALLCYGEFSVIKSLLTPESVALWKQQALALAGAAALTLGYAAWCWRRGQRIGAWYAGAALAAYGALLWVGTHYSDRLVSPGVPSWMVPTEPLLYVWTFLMPSLAHALLVLVVRATPDDRPHRALPSFGLAAAVPVATWVAFWVPWAIYRHFNRWPHPHWFTNGLFAVLLTVGPLAFLFYLVRGAYIIGLNRTDSPFGLAWKILVALVLPVLGLLVNKGLFLDGLFGGTQKGIFGDFSSLWFFGLAVLNGLLLCCPAPARPGRRLALLAGRSVLLGYTAYFFVVFLPFLPLSVLAVIAAGVGFLLLTPLVLLVVHVRVLADDAAALGPHFGWWAVRAVLVGGAAVLPLCITASFWHDRRVLHAALAYVYRPNYAQRYALDAGALARTLAVVRQHKDQPRDIFMGTQQPYLSMYFNWLVLDNLTLSEAKIKHLEAVFVRSETQPAPTGNPGASPTAAALARPGPIAPVLRRLAARSRYDAPQQAWVSWVELEVANADPARPAGEYRTAFELPAGCFVGNYYLDINGRREAGILAEKRAADWVYAQILQERTYRDPGLLTYAGPNRLQLSVYPVVRGARRRTGFELLHKEPIALTIDGQTLALGDSVRGPAPAAPAATPSGAVVYLGAAAKQRLPLVQRRPYYHFLLDVSAGKAGRKPAYKQWVTRFLQRQPRLGPPRFTLVNAYATPVPAGRAWQSQLDAFPNAGGCYLTGAVQRVLADAQLHPAPSYPVLVVVTDSLATAVLAPDFADLAPTYPEGDGFLVLGPDGRTETRSLRQPFAAALPATGAPAGRAVRAWPTAAHARAYLPDDGQPAVVLRQPQAPLAPRLAPAPGSRWLAGLQLQGYSQWQTLHPAAADDQRVAFVQASFANRILTPSTSFLALENEAQKAALLRKQAQTLAANSSLDAQEEPANLPTAVPLDEGALWLLLLGLGLGTWALGRQR